MAYDESSPNLEFRSSDYTTISPGPFIGIVKDNVDPTKMGGLRVMIPSFSGASEGPTSMLYDVKYLMPFYGAKSPNATTKTSPYDFDDSPHSYGMWMVPPDIDSRVLVIFLEGKVGPGNGYWIGCVQEPYTNHMIPGIAASSLSAVDSNAGDSESKESRYGTNQVPVTELNRKALENGSSLDPTNDKLFKKPIHPFANTLRQQGLIQDTIRGTTTSSARRESPSAVFGISTPGRVDPNSSKKFKLGPTDNNPERPVSRDAGHTFVMDDGDAAEQNRLVRLRTSSGHQLLMHDTAGVVYLANGSGKVWMEFAADGTIDIYSGAGINIRSTHDLNLHSDQNINMFAKGQIKMSALQRLVIDGGMIMTHSDTDTIMHSGGSFTNKAVGGSIISYAGMAQLHMATGPHHLTGEEVHFNSTYTNPDMISDVTRTAVQDESPYGTNTLRVDIPEVETRFEGANGNIYFTADYRLLKCTPTGNVGMDGMSVPTHEPWPKHADLMPKFHATADDSDGDTPGTQGYLARQNRLGPFAEKQYEADFALHLKNLNIPKTDINALWKAAEDFSVGYPTKFNIGQSTLDLSSIASASSSTINRTIESLTGNAAKVLVNQAGVLFTSGNLGQVVTGSVTSTLNDLSSIKNVFNTTGNVLGGVQSGLNNLQNIARGGLNNLTNLGGVQSGLNSLQSLARGGIQGGVNSLQSLASNAIGGAANRALGGALGKINNIAGQVNVVTDIYKNVIGRQITSVTQIKSVVGMIGNQIGSTIASVGRSIGKIFGF